MLGIQNALQTVDGLKNLAVDGIKLAKAAKGGALKWGEVVAGVLRVAGDVKALVASAPAALPELKDLDAAEAGQLGAAGYGCVAAIVAELKAA